ncbi:mitochondrial RNA-editing ligase [Acrasis kona]|uniref:Mitochondrial RNA-editing ligase n=1 Tax=Acrasis kona TaxID=1008807 RepID=A0AAW2Z9K0_9EUKA
MRAYILRQLSGDEFIEYPTIELPSQKLYSTIRNCDQFALIKEWFVTEKVHGSNFSFIVDTNNAVNFAKRTSLIKDFTKSSFYPKAVHDVVAKYKHAAIEVRSVVCSMFHQEGISNDVMQINIYGELFGGKYTHPDVKQVEKNPIFHEVSYCPHFDFYAFDVLVTLADGRSTWLLPGELDSILSACGFPVNAKPLFVGTF